MGSIEIWNLRYRVSFAFVGIYGSKECNEKRPKPVPEMWSKAPITITRVFIVNGQEEEPEETTEKT